MLIIADYQEKAREIVFRYSSNKICSLCTILWVYNYIFCPFMQNIADYMQNLAEAVQIVDRAKSVCYN